MLKKLPAFPFQNWFCFFACFLGIGFAAPSSPFWALFFYSCFLPLLGWHLYQNRQRVKRELRDNLSFWPVCTLLCCFLWIFAVTCAALFRGASSFYPCLNFLFTLFFIVGCWEALRERAESLRDILFILAAGGAFNCFIGLLGRIGGYNFDFYAPERWAGWGVFHPAVFAGDIAGLSFLSAFLLWRDRRQEKKHWAGIDFFYFFLFCFDGVFLFFNGTRMASIGLFWLLLALGRQELKRALWASLGIVLPLFGFILAQSVARGKVPEFLSRLDSGHFEIWQKTLIQLRPYFWLGQGALLKMKIPDGAGGFFPHPHSLYLSLLWQGGIVGCFFFLGSSCFLFFKGIQNAESRKILVVFLYALSCALTDWPYLFKGPSEEWIFIWLLFTMMLFSLTAQRVPRPYAIVKSH